MNHYMEVYDLYKKMEAMIRSRMKDWLQQSDISGMEFRFLKCVDESEILTLSNITKRIGKHNSHTTLIIDSLEKKGLVKRASDCKDRRVIRIRYTSKGVQFRKEVLKRHEQRIVEFLQDVDECFLEQTAACFEYFIEKLENHDCHTLKVKKNLP